MISELISTTLLLAVPLLLAATGGLVNRRAGIVNIGLEGQMLLGAFVGTLVSGHAHSWLTGTLVAGAAGAVGGLLMSLVITRLGANQIIVGLGFTLAMTGLVGYVMKSAFGGSGTLRVDGLQQLPNLTIPVLDGVPVLGALVSGKDPLFWLCVVLVPLTAAALGRTAWGIRLRATGDSEPAARALGLPTLAIRDASTTVAGLLAGLAGAHLALGQVGLFNEHMVAGRGYIALAAFFFGRARPWPTAAACLVFAGFDTLQVRLQVQNLPADLVQTLPYLAVIAALTATAVRGARPRNRSWG